MESKKKISKKNFSVPTVRKLVEASDEIKANGDTPKKKEIQEGKETDTARSTKKSKPRTTEKSSVRKNQRPLSDAEYREIFHAVLQQISLSSVAEEENDEGIPEKTPCDTSDDIYAASTQDDPPEKSPEGQGNDDSVSCGNETEADKRCPGDDGAVADDQERQSDDPEKEKEAEEEKDDVVSIASEQSSASSLEAIAMEVDQWDRAEDFQQDNNHTPQASKTEESCVHTPVIKNKTKKRAARANKLAPRKLCFDDPTPSTSADSGPGKPAEKKERPSAAKISKPFPKEKKKKLYKPSLKGTAEILDLAVRKMAAEQQPVKEEEVPAELGTWVQCSQQQCKKWRYLPDVQDPLHVADCWNCSMHPDSRYNSCEKEEQEYDESDHIFTRYTLGSLVWVKMDGYPWWPGMIDIDPDYDIYCEVPSEESMYPTDFHVVFLDERVSRAWMRVARIRPMQFSDLAEFSPYLRGHKFRKGVSTAMRKAREAFSIPLQERLQKFGFATSSKNLRGRQPAKQARGRGHGKIAGREEKLKTVYRRTPEITGTCKPKPSPGSSGDDSKSDALFCTGYFPDSDPSNSSDRDFDNLHVKFQNQHCKVHKLAKSAKRKTQCCEIYSDEESSIDSESSADDASDGEEKKTKKRCAETSSSKLCTEKEKTDEEGIADRSQKCKEVCNQDFKKKKKGFSAPQLPSTEHSSSLVEESETVPKKKKKKTKDMNISVNSSDTLTLTSKPKQALQKPAQASKEKKPKVQESTEPVAKVQTESTQDKKKIHSQKKSDTSQSPSSTEAHHFKKPKKRKQSEVAVNAEEKLEVPKKRKKGNAIQRSVGPAAKSPERTEATPSKEQDSKDFFASLKLEAQSCEEGSQKKKLKLQKKGTVQISEKTPSLENPSSAEKPSKKKKRNAETHPDAEGKVKPTKRKPEKKTAVSATDEKKKSKSQKFMVPSRQSADGGTKAETTVTSEDKHGSPHRQNTAPKSNTQDSKKARGTSRVVPSPSNEAKAKVPCPERKELSGKRSSSTISADRDQFVPDNDVPHDVLELNDEEDVLPMLSETKAAIVSTDDVIEGGGDDSDCLDLDLEEDIPIPCLQQVMGVKGKGQSDDDGADSDPLEMAED